MYVRHITKTNSRECEDIIRHPFIRSDDTRSQQLFYFRFILSYTGFAFIVVWMSSYFKCPVAFSHGAVGWSAVCDCGIS